MGNKLGYFVAAFIVLSVNAHAGEMDIFCAQFKQEAENTKSKNYSRAKFQGIVVDCEARKVQYKTQGKKNYFGNPQMWLKKIQSNWNQAVCQDQASANAAQAGWKIIEALVFADGQTLNVIASCPIQ